MWHGMQMITGYIEKENRICVENENQVANEMNIFFARFETTDLAQERSLELETLNSENGLPENGFPVTWCHSVTKLACLLA